MIIPFLKRTVSPDSKWKPAPHINWTESEGQIAVVDAQEGKVYHFNGVGAAVWAALENRTADEIAAQVADRFDAPVLKIQKDVSIFLAELHSQDLIEEV